MKARFYRGPMDGKTREVADPNMRAIAIAYSPKGSHRYWDPNDSYASVMLSHKQTMYYRTQFHHPDGSVFFEWSEKKGTKI